MSILQLSSVEDLRIISREIFAKGWGEANGGNISIRIPTDEVLACANELKEGKEIKLPYTTPDLAGEYFLVTGTGVFFRHVYDNPEASLGIVRINEKGDGYTPVWGFVSGGRPTSELSSHLLSHEMRKKVSGGKDRIVLHTHATNLIALSFVLPLDTAVVTRELWEMMSECLVLFPEGIGIMDWMMPGKSEIGYATAELMKSHRLVLWAHHGIFGAADTLDTAFGLIETADKAAEMLLKVLAAGGKRQAITSKELRALGKAFNVTPLEAALY